VGPWKAAVEPLFEARLCADRDAHVMSDDDLDDLLSEPNRRGRRPGMPVDPGRLLLSVKRDWRWIPLAAAIWAALGLLVAFLFITHTYLSQTVLVWEPKGSDSGRPDERLLATEAGSLKLPGAIRKIRQRLKLAVPVDTLQKQIEVLFDTRSNLVTVEATGPSARDATVLANTVVQVFLETQTDIARSRAQESQKALEGDIKVAQAKLDQARNLYDAFRAENGISDITQETGLAVANISELKANQQQARAEFDQLTGQIASLEEQAKTQPKTTLISASVGNPRLAELRNELAIATARFSPDHPRLQILRGQIRELEKRGGGSDSPVGTVGANPQQLTIAQALSTAKASLLAVTERIKSYDGLIQSAEQRSGSLRSLQGEARGLTAEVELGERRLNELQAQLSQARDAARTPQVEWRVLTPAVEPEWPERSKRRWIVAGMPILGMLVALLALLIRPLLDARVYTAREAGYWANTPVLGSSTWPRNPEMLFTLSDELSHHGAVAPGYTLVVGATGREKAHAEELAYWLGGGGFSDRKREHGPAARVRVTAAPPAGVHSAASGASGGGAAATVLSSEALVPVARQGGGAPLALYPQGTHAWLGATDGPALRRAARMADRVIVLLTSGAEVFTAVAGLKTRLGREAGVGLVMIGLSSELLKLPDRVGDVETFWARRQ
jgi:uncharacterized protein involved in exopolysaccharide biosynthesis